MSNKEDLMHMPRRVNEIHDDVFYSGRKKRELNNFMYGILLAIGASILVGVVIKFISDSLMIKKNLYLINQSLNITYNITEFELFKLQADNAFLAIGGLYLLLFSFLGIILIYLSLMLYTGSNADLLGNRKLYKYKRKKSLTIEQLAEKTNQTIINQLRRNKKNKWLRTRIVVRKTNINIIEYHFWKRWLFEKTNRILIKDEEIIVLYSISKHGEAFGKFVREKLIPSLKKSRFIKLV